MEQRKVRLFLWRWLSDLIRDKTAEALELEGQKEPEAAHYAEGECGNMNNKLKKPSIQQKAFLYLSIRAIMITIQTTDCRNWN